MSSTRASLGPRHAPRRRTSTSEGDRSLDITLEGRLLLALLGAFSLAALLMGEELVLFAGLMALGVGLASGLAVRQNLRGVVVRRSVPSRGRAGLPVRVAYEIEHEGRGTAVGLQVADPLGGPTQPRRLSASLPALPAGRRIEVAQPVVFGRRGRYTLHRPRVTTRFPLALFEASTPCATTEEILVRPREGRPTMRLRQALAGRVQAFHQPSLRLPGDDVFHGIREYRDGDDPRRIHWRTTARRGVLTVAEWHREEGREVVVFLGRGPGIGMGAQADFERAVSVAATVLRLAARHGLRTRLVLGTPEEQRRVAPRNPVRAALDALALVKPHGGRKPRSSLRDLALVGGSRVVCYVTSGPEPGIHPRLHAAAGAKGTPVLLEAHRPTIRRWVRGLP